MDVELNKVFFFLGGGGWEITLNLLGVFLLSSLLDKSKHMELSPYIIPPSTPLSSLISKTKVVKPHLDLTPKA